MTFIIENFELILTILLVVLIVVMLIVLSYSYHISKFFSNRKFRIIGRYEYEPTTATNQFVLQLFNNNVNDSRLIGFGFMYKEQTIDYYKTYFTQKQLDLPQQLIVLSRDSFRMHLQAKDLETIIYDYNKGRRRIAKIYVYATDSQGITTTSIAHEIRKIIVKDLKEKIKQDKQSSKQQKAQFKKEQKEEKKNKRTLQRMQRRERWFRFWLVLKTKLRRKPRIKRLKKVNDNEPMS